MKLKQWSKISWKNSDKNQINAWLYKPNIWNISQVCCDSWQIPMSSSLSYAQLFLGSSTASGATSQSSSNSTSSVESFNRILIQNLPLNFTKDDVFKHFQVGEILKNRKSGNPSIYMYKKDQGKNILFSFTIVWVAAISLIFKQCLRAHHKSKYHFKIMCLQLWMATLGPKMSVLGNYSNLWKFWFFFRSFHWWGHSYLLRTCCC